MQLVFGDSQCRFQYDLIKFFVVNLRFTEVDYEFGIGFLKSNMVDPIRRTKYFVLYWYLIVLVSTCDESAISFYKFNIWNQYDAFFSLDLI